jgi:segregation and condensation protein A
MAEGEGSERYSNNPTDDSGSSEKIVETKKKISSPPLNLLFNPSLIIKKDIWQIDIVALLQMLVRLIDNSDRRDLRLCGVAALTSSMIHRLKVESIFRLEKIAMQKKGVDEVPLSMPIVELKPMEIPYRFEPTYPVNLEDLLGLLETILNRLTNPKQQKKDSNLNALDTFDFDQYFIKIEQILQEREDIILAIVNADGTIVFSTFVSRMTPIEAARNFLAILYLAMKGEVELQQIVDADDKTSREDIIISRVGEKV